VSNYNFSPDFFGAGHGIRTVPAISLGVCPSRQNESVRSFDTRRNLSIPAAPEGHNTLSLEEAMRASEVLLALAFLQQSLEHLCGSTRDRLIFGLRLGFCLLLLSGSFTGVALVGLIGLSVVILWRFQGPYNGGSDRMGLLILWCVALAQAMPTPVWQERVFGYLAVQLILSYFVSGKVKLMNPEWRSGQALADVFAFSVYPVSEGLRQWAHSPRLLWVASWSVILFEVVFPLALINQTLLIIALCLAAMFHFANACLFGLNRFFWTWIAAYPSILWLQGRVM